MKKLIVFATLFFGLAFAASAQQRAIGVRALFGAEVSFTQDLAIAGGDFVEAEVGFSAISSQSSINGQILNNMYILNEGGFGVYWGYGLGAGLALGEISAIHADALVQCGVDYKLDSIPLVFSLDLRPVAGIYLGNASGIHANLLNLGVGIRYRF